MVAFLRARMVALALMPTVGAAAGAMLDEHGRLGVTVWLSTCRADGVSIPSLLHFTWQLLPNMIAGALSGGLLVMLLAWHWRGLPARLEECAAAHIGCLFAMPLTMLVCALAIPMRVMPVVDLLIGALAGLAMLPLIRRVSRENSAHP